MKKSILIYNILVYVVSFILSVIEIVTADFKIETLLLAGISSMVLLSLYFIYEKKIYIVNALVFLSILNFIQAFSVIIYGLTYRLIIGPEITLYFLNVGDKLIKISAKAFNIFSYFNYIENDMTLALGINFLHLLMFIYFYFEVKKIRKNENKFS